ncbi:MAG: hypothetical protein HFE77_05555 [Clostridiales bacterium]|nr:hypothetical protein [Clostridiales bacterium]
MRELKECKAEVFRRSENRIKERKRHRKRLLISLAPFCFGLVVLSAAYLPMITTMNHKMSSPAGGIGTDLPDSDTNNPQGIITELPDADQSLTNKNKGTGEETADQLLAIIQDTFQNEGSQTKDADTYGQNEEQSFGIPTTTDRVLPPDTQTITCITPEGEQVVYTLDGNKLIDESTNQEILLTDELQAELQKLLDLITAKKETEK